MKRHLTGPEVAKMLGVKPDTVRAWRWRGTAHRFINRRAKEHRQRMTLT
jgi:uncharacterized protein YjcR